MEGICFICYFRIHGGQASVPLRVGDRWRLVHRHHADEGVITLTTIRHNIVDEVVEERASR